MRIADRPFAIAALLALIVSVLPTRIVGGVLVDVSGVVTALLNPPAHLLQLVREWLRPPQHDRGPDDPVMRELLRERDTYRSQWHAARQEVLELERKLEQAGAIRRADPSGAWRLVDAAVGMSTPAAGQGIVLAPEAAHKPAVTLFTDWLRAEAGALAVPSTTRVATVPP